jgi:hypothetical protein
MGITFFSACGQKRNFARPGKITILALVDKARSFDGVEKFQLAYLAKRALFASLQPKIEIN